KQKISGVMTGDTKIYTRCLRWKIEKCVANTQSTILDKVKCPNGSSGGGSDREGDFAAQPPWSSVNNCTGCNQR
ncbi:MAG TPA: replication endonuclease, partial [Nitrosomonas nitrosa]|nr:replication endonuclease [Nitrosomonas nitrosa]